MGLLVFVLLRGGHVVQDELWQEKSQGIVGFVEPHHRNPLKHRVEKHLMLNFIKQNCKLLNVGKMKAERIEKFNELLSISEQFKYVNQSK